MGAIFPLSTSGRIILILIAVVIGLIWSMFQFPDFWRRLYKKQKPEVKPNDKLNKPIPPKKGE